MAEDASITRSDTPSTTAGSPLRPDPRDPTPETITLSPAGLPERIGPYRVRGVLGRGGMGIVYEAIDERSPEPIPLALKTVETRHLDLSDPTAIHRFRHEISALERLAHPSIVRLFDFGVAQHPMGFELAYYVMERLDGVALVEVLRVAETLPRAEALWIAECLARAVHHLSEHGILHRDIKPANVFLDRSGRVVLLDFGLAYSEDFTRLTLAGQIVGTFSYMSPERLAGAPVGPPSDVFAVGVVLFQLLTGQHPFGFGSPDELMSHMQRGIEWPRGALAIDPASALGTLLGSMLAFQANARPSPANLAERLSTLRSADPTGPVRLGRPEWGMPGERRGPTETLILPPIAPPPPLLGPSSGSSAAATWITPEPAPSHPIGPSDPTIARPKAPRPGPSWPVVWLLVASFACLAFALGLLLGGARSSPHPLRAIELRPEGGPNLR